MLAVSLVIVSQLLVTRFSGERIENYTYETSSRSYFTTHMVGHKVKVVEFWEQQKTANVHNVDIYETLNLVSGDRNVLSLRLLFSAL